jgi:peptide/nickel transport system substrate-binding protein
MWLSTLTLRPIQWLCLGGLAFAYLGAADAAELRVGVKGFPVTFANPYVAANPTSDAVLRAVFDGLTRLDANGSPAPALALSWQTLTPTSWRFKLRRDAVFSNGEPMNANAVTATFSWLQSPEGARTAAGHYVRGIVKTEAEDPYSVIIHTAQPDAILPNRLSAIAIVAPSAWRGLGPDTFAQTPVGTGAFTLEDWGSASGRISFKANFDSWRAPKADSLVLINFPDAAARVQALLSGRIHIASNLDLENIEAAQSGGAFVTPAPAMSVAAIALRQDVGRASPLKDVRVRQALNYAIDKPQLNAEVLRGLSEPSGQAAGRWTSGHNPNVRPYPYDPDQAKALLFEAGIVTSFGLRFDVVTDQMPGDAAMMSAIAAQLAGVGIEAHMREISYGRWLESFASGIWPNDTDGFILAFNSMPTNDIQSALEPYSCINPAPFFCDETLTAEMTAVNEEMDFSRRLELLDDLAQKVHDLAPAIFLTEQFDLFAVSRNVSGFAVAGRIPVYESISVDE